MTELSVILVVAGFLIIILKGKSKYKPTGRIKGVCIEVKIEQADVRSTAHNGQMRGKDSRRYRPYIKYQIGGEEYIAKSETAFTQPKYFPGDEVEIMINDENRESVKIVG